MTSTTQQLLRDIDLFNLVFPVGTKLQANLVTGVTEVEVTGQAELIGGEPMFKGTYGKNFTPLLPCQSVQIPENYFADWFNEKYPVGTWVWCKNGNNQPFASLIVNEAIEDQKWAYFVDQTTTEPIRNVKGKLDAIIEFEDHGQDFLRWYINELGIVVDSKPFQAGVWNGSKVLFDDDTKVGDDLTYVDKHDDDLMTINYPIKSIQRFEYKKEVQHG